MEIECSNSTDFEMEHQSSGENIDIADCIMVEVPYSIESNEFLGRHLVAQRNISQGEMIIYEKPLGKTIFMKRKGSLWSTGFCSSWFKP